MEERIITDALDRADIVKTPEFIRLTSRYIDILKVANEKTNLTAITGDEMIGTRHLQDSWMLSEHIPENITLIDIGSGAGFPGLALKIVRPDLDVTLIDSVRKKIDFLNSAIEQLELRGIRALHGRAEEFARDSLYRDRFGVAVARAVTSLPTLLELSLPLVKPGGLFIAMKGQDDETEESRHALEQLKGRLKAVIRYELPDADQTRSLVMVHKLVPTPSRYPRRMAVIKKHSL